MRWKHVALIPTRRNSVDNGNNNRKKESVKGPRDVLKRAPKDCPCRAWNCIETGKGPRVYSRRIKGLCREPRDIIYGSRCLLLAEMMTVPERVLAHLIPPRFPKHYQSHPPLASAVFWAATLATSVRSIPVHPRATYSAVKKQKTTEFEQWTIFQLLAGMFSHAIHISTHIVYQMFPIVKKRRKFFFGCNKECFCRTESICHGAFSWLLSGCRSSPENELKQVIDNRSAFFCLPHTISSSADIFVEK